MGHQHFQSGRYGFLNFQIFQKWRSYEKRQLPKLLYKILFFKLRSRILQNRPSNLEESRLNATAAASVQHIDFQIQVLYLAKYILKIWGIKILNATAEASVQATDFQIEV